MAYIQLGKCVLGHVWYWQVCQVYTTLSLSLPLLSPFVQIVTLKHCQLKVKRWLLDARRPLKLISYKKTARVDSLV